MKSDFSEKVVLITGAARGIGLSIAEAFGARGATTCLVDIQAAAGQEAVAQLKSKGIQAAFLECDLSKPGAAQRMIQDVVAQHRRLDVLVNNARAGKRLDFMEETERSWDEAFNVNLKAAFFASQEAVRVMKEGGRILNISSVAAQLVTHESPAYHISKAGLVQMTRYLAVQAAPQQIGVNAIMPGFIVQDEHWERFAAENNREFGALCASYHPGGKPGRSLDVANAALFLCSSDSSYISGQCLTLDGAATCQDQFALLRSFSKKDP